MESDNLREKVQSLQARLDVVRARLKDGEVDRQAEAEERQLVRQIGEAVKGLPLQQRLELLRETM